MSRTVAERRFQSRSMTSASSGPRNFSSALSGLRSLRRSGRRTARLSRAPASDGDAPAAAEEPGMAFAEVLTPVRQRHVELDDEMAVPWDVQRTARPLPALDDTRQGEHLELSFGVSLLDASPHRGPLGGLLAERKRVEEPEPPRIGKVTDSPSARVPMRIASAGTTTWMSVIVVGRSFR